MNALDAEPDQTDQLASAYKSGEFGVGTGPLRTAIGELGRITSDDPTDTVVAQVIQPASRGLALASLIIGTSFD